MAKLAGTKMRLPAFPPIAPQDESEQGATRRLPGTTQRKRSATSSGNSAAACLGRPPRAALPSPRSTPETRQARGRSHPPGTFRARENRNGHPDKGAESAEPRGANTRHRKRTTRRASIACFLAALASLRIPCADAKGARAADTVLWK